MANTTTPSAASPHAAAGEHGAPMTPAQAALKALRNQQNQAFPESLWYIILGILGFLTLAHITVRGMSALRKYRSLHRALEAPPPDAARAPNPRGPVSVRRLPLAAANAFRIVFCRWTIPLSNATLADACFSLGYTFLMLYWSFISCASSMHSPGGGQHC